MTRSAALRASLALMALAIVAVAVPAASEASVKPRSLSNSQAAILSHGFKLKLANAKHADKRVRVRVESRTFDDPGWAKLSKSKRVTVKGSSHKRLRLKLTGAGKTAVAGCEARDLRVKIGPSQKRRSLNRDTPGCTPKPVDLSRSGECDFIGQQQGSECLMPFPDDYYTVADPSTATGRRVDLKTAATPANVSGQHVAAGPYNLNDGFSPGQSIVLKVPGLDTPAALAATDPVQLNHLGRYSEADTPVVVIDAATGERIPIWVELDSNATSPEKTALMINPAVNFASGHRYIVALRNLKSGDGSTIPAPEGFRYYRDELPSSEPAIEAQRGRFEAIFDALRGAQVRRSNLYLAWDFTVATDQNIAGRMLHIRNDAFASLGDTTMADMTAQGTAPAFNVSSVVNSPADPEVAREIKGTYTVPCYLHPSCAPGGSFELDSNGMPTRNGDYQANFDCIIPRVAADGPTPQIVRPSLYGHGLFGDATQVHGQYQKDLANDHGFILCATDEIGMASSDLANTLGILGDLSRFPELADRLQEGLLTELFLGRLMINPAGFGSNVAFHADGTGATSSVINTQRLFYDGNSQGGIMGGALAAVAPDFDRAALGVPAMRYSILLPRSVDYDAFAAPLGAAYTDELARPLLLSMIQMLWDRGEPNGYAHRMTTNPLPDTPPHTILMGPAIGDHQVTNWASDVEARTIGASARAPVVDDGRWPDTDVLWNVPRIQSYPFSGSVISYNDFGPVRPNPSNPSQNIGTPPAPLTNTPNRVGEDPHGAPRGIPLGLAEVSNFLVNGSIANLCGPKPCYGGLWTGL
jgi:hypothetical protein